MATNETLKNQLSQQNQKQVPANQLGLKGLMNTPTMKRKFEEVLHENANAFMSNVMTLVSNDSYLAESEPMSILSGALTAATLNLGLDKNLGYAYLVPFNTKNKQTGKWERKAQFILGYKGYIQLAQRSGKYKALNVIEVYEGELLSWNRLTEEFEFDPNGRQSDDVIGYVGYFELLNGFKKTVYWTKQEIEAHRIANSKDKEKTKLSGVWATDYNAMARKTVLRNMLSKWGILSIEMQEATTSDEKVQQMQEDGNIISETEVEENTTMKTAEVIKEADSDSLNQTDLFDTKNPPLE
ncbi:MULTISPECIES: recombinase RecT [Enterococcus]|uniref:recombinase RecT n=1 Tax=Enterococcus TaxID=1350 RepID=UPI000F813BE0|nr:recombinase RecT [Enterococcus faecalis]EGO2800771.1 recombinase RecT [Enterococcus faecalis]EHZ9212454.1 recombinase RecT [Enterococcus faecalis]EJB2752905.1 recombinase RecT [Enterococcus faecalis]EKZ0433592.1 recombinase RecT [Enterococcus faecalis]MCU9782008.1 recombinase RecT [Enterococcus faecalis]